MKIRYVGQSIFVLCLLIILTSCVSLEERKQKLNQELDQWKGRHFTDVVAEWGAPTSILPDGQDGQIYVYDVSSSYTTGGTSTPITNKEGKLISLSHTPSTTHTVKMIRSFYIDKEGIIYRVAWKGLGRFFEDVSSED